MITAQAISQYSKLSSQKSMSAIPFETFLLSVQNDLGAILASEQTWAQKYVPTWPKLSKALQFKGNYSAVDVKTAFLKSIRVNPKAKIPLYLQILPGDSTPADMLLSDADVANEVTGIPAGASFRKITMNTAVSMRDVIITAADEPDYGFDVRLFEDNVPFEGVGYGFGKQPFAVNSKIPYASQGPFHMGFYHEAKIIETLKPALKHSYPAARIHLYETLSKFAFAHHQAYWGARFAGWAIHYIQDLTQPYHTTAAPGAKTKQEIMDGLEALFNPTAENNLIQLQTNRHIALEDYQLNTMIAAMKNHNEKNTYLATIAATENSDGMSAWLDNAPIDFISLKTCALAAETAAVIEGSFPFNDVDNSAVHLGENGSIYDAVAAMNQQSEAQRSALDQQLGKLLGRAGIYTRLFLDYLPLP